MKNLFILLTFFNASLVLAKAELTKEQQEKRARYTRTIVDESAMNRDGKRFTVNAHLLGSSFRTASRGISLGYYLAPNKVLQLRYEALDGEYDLDGSRDEYEGEYISFEFKKFTGNSFYLSLGFYYKDQTFEDFDNDDFDVPTDYKTLGAIIRIGNQWQWDDFTLGCDWIGLGKDLAILDIDGNSEDEAEDFLGLGLNFYLGVSF